MNPQTSHGAIQSYLDRVKRNLSTDPVEGEEILQQVEEHIHELLRAKGVDPLDGRGVEAVLAEMDPPESYGHGVVETKKPFPMGLWVRFFFCLLLGAIAFVVLEQDRREGDDIDLPFVDDPQVLGEWVSVDFVERQDDFRVGERTHAGDLYLKGLTFLEEGKVEAAPWWTWTKGVLMHSGDRTASAYTIEAFDGVPFLFLEWKNGDVLHRGQEPKLYVMRKMERGGAMADGDEALAREAALFWLSQLDAGNVKGSYQTSARFFRDKVSLEQWEGSVSMVRERLGTLVSRDFMAAQHLTSLPGAPDGNYLVLQYRSSFEKKGDVIETVTPMGEKDGSWKVSGYYFR